MTGLSVDLLQTDFALLIRACCGKTSGDAVDQFREAWLEFLRADLTPFTSSMVEIRTVLDTAWPEYRDKFAAAHNSGFDYVLYFQAIAYAHLSHLRKDQGIQKLLAALPPSEILQGVGHTCCVLVFVTLLKIEDGCGAYLLDLSFDLASEGTDTHGCVRDLEQAFRQAGWLR
jgi:hypothetical protein